MIVMLEREDRTRGHIAQERVPDPSLTGGAIRHMMGTLGRNADSLTSSMPAPRNNQLRLNLANPPGAVARSS